MTIVLLVAVIASIIIITEVWKIHPARQRRQSCFCWRSSGKGRPVMILRDINHDHAFNRRLMIILSIPVTVGVICHHRQYKWVRNITR